MGGRPRFSWSLVLHPGDDYEHTGKHGSSLHAGIVGGSVAGLAAATCLIESGIQITVFERSAGELSGRGAGIALDPGVLSTLGNIPEHHIEGRIVLSNSGEELWRKPVSKFMTAWSVV